MAKTIDDLDLVDEGEMEAVKMDEIADGDGNGRTDVDEVVDILRTKLGASTEFLVLELGEFSDLCEQLTGCYYDVLQRYIDENPDERSEVLGILFGGDFDNLKYIFDGRVPSVPSVLLGDLPVDVDPKFFVLEPLKVMFRS